ncbi:MAG: tetratricopeptide repeat protein, partial [Anaerolineales bacterium]|nr:tetratricopeptide repeat protein [Anaerolineales bacterium]
YAYLSELLAEIGELDAARQAAQYTLRLGHDLPDDQIFSEHARMHTLLGRLMRQSGQLDQAIQHLSEAIQLSPHDLTAYLELGQTHLSRRKHQDAINIFNQAIEAFPDSPESYFQAAVALKEAKDYLQAEQMLRQAARLAPQDLAIQRQLGAIIALNLVHNRKS